MANGDSAIPSNGQANGGIPGWIERMVHQIGAKYAALQAGGGGAPTTGFGALGQQLGGIGGDIASAIGQRYGPLNVPAGQVPPGVGAPGSEAFMGGGGPPALPGGGLVPQAQAAPAPPGGLPGGGIPGGQALPTFARPDIPGLSSLGGPGGQPQTQDMAPAPPPQAQTGDFMTMLRDWAKREGRLDPDIAISSKRPDVGEAIDPADKYPNWPLPTGILRKPQYPGQKNIYPGGGLPPVPIGSWAGQFDIPLPVVRPPMPGATGVRGGGPTVTGPITRLDRPPAPGLTAYPQPQGTQDYGVEGVRVPGGVAGPQQTLQNQMMTLPDALNRIAAMNPRMSIKEAGALATEMVKENNKRVTEAAKLAQQQTHEQHLQSHRGVIEDLRARGLLSTEQARKETQRYHRESGQRAQTRLGIQMLPQLQEQARVAGFDMSTVTPTALQRLLAHPKKADDFDEYYKLKPGTAAFIIDSLKSFRGLGGAADEGEGEDEGEETAETDAQ